MKPYATLILLRHGQSVYNKQNLFTGWTDVELSEQGKQEAEQAGEMLKRMALFPDIVFTSWLRRAIHTQQIALAAMAWEHIDVCRSWRLNERHYGAWQQRDKDAVKAEVGETLFLAVRRGWDTPPPPLPENDSRCVTNDPKYAGIDPVLLPRSESLKDTYARVKPYFDSEIVPRLKEGKTVLVSAHGNSLRALVKEIEQLSDDAVVSLEIPTGKPIVYHYDEYLEMIAKMEPD